MNAGLENLVDNYNPLFIAAISFSLFSAMRMAASFAVVGIPQDGFVWE